MIKRVKKSKFHNNQTGASLVEYALLVALIAVVVMAGARSVGSSLVVSYQDMTQDIEAASGGVCDPNLNSFCPPPG